MNDDELKAKLLSMMWTPEMFDRFESDLRELFKKADPEFLARTTEAEREELIASLKKKAIDLTGLQTQTKGDKTTLTPFGV